MKIGVFPRTALLCKRFPADWRLPQNGDLARANFSATVGGADCTRLTLSADHIFRTPSYAGRALCTKEPSGTFFCAERNTTEPSNLRRKYLRNRDDRSLVASSSTTKREGIPRCLSQDLQAPLWFWRSAAVFPPAATPWANRLSTAARQVSAGQRSSMATSSPAPRLVRPRTWPTASNTPLAADAPASARLIRRPVYRAYTASGPRAWRGASRCASSHAKDGPCSRKS